MRRPERGSFSRPPLPMASRPASNCGLTRKTPHAPGAASASAGGSASFSEMKLTSQTTISGCAVAEMIGGQIAGVEAFEQFDARIGGKLGASWPWPTSMRDDMARAALQQHLREAAGGGADVERELARSDRCRKRRARRRASARRARRRRCAGSSTLSLGMSGTARPGLTATLAGDAHRAPQNGIAGARTAGEEPRRDEKFVQPQPVIGQV